MSLELIPVLEVLNGLYSQRRTTARFRLYLAQMVGTNEAGETDIVLPIMGVNPMGREHCLAAIEALQAIDAEAAVREALDEAQQRLGDLSPNAKVAINLFDDARGQWTNRYFTEAEMRLGSERAQRAGRTRHFIVVPCWTSEQYTPEVVRQETVAAVYRTTAGGRLELPRTLSEQMQREGQAIAFATHNTSEAAAQLAPALSAAKLAEAHAAISPHLAATDFPTQFACFFGDEAAISVGYPGLGVANRAGFAVAMADALASGVSPEAALRQAVHS